MKKFLASVLLLLCSAAPLRAEDSKEGPAEQSVRALWDHLEFILDHCLVLKLCGLSEAETALLTKIRKTHYEEKLLIGGGLAFASGREQPDLFALDGQGCRRSARTENRIGARVYFNSDDLYTTDAKGQRFPVGFFDMLGLLIHELGHHHSDADHSVLDALGAKVRKTIERRATIRTLAPLLPHVEVILLPFTLSRIEEAALLVNGAGFEAVTHDQMPRLWVRDGLGLNDVRPLLIQYLPEAPPGYLKAHMAWMQNLRLDDVYFQIGHGVVRAMLRADWDILFKEQTHKMFPKPFKSRMRLELEFRNKASLRDSWPPDENAMFFFEGSPGREWRSSNAAVNFLTLDADHSQFESSLGVLPHDLNYEFELKSQSPKVLDATGGIWVVEGEITTDFDGRTSRRINPVACRAFFSSQQFQRQEGLVRAELLFDRCELTPLGEKRWKLRLERRLAPNVTHTIEDLQLTRLELQFDYGLNAQKRAQAEVNVLGVTPALRVRGVEPKVLPHLDGWKVDVKPPFVRGQGRWAEYGSLIEMLFPVENETPIAYGRFRIRVFFQDGITLAFPFEFGPEAERNPDARLVSVDQRFENGVVYLRLKLRIDETMKVHGKIPWAIRMEAIHLMGENLQETSISPSGELVVRLRRKCGEILGGPTPEQLRP